MLVGTEAGTLHVLRLEEKEKKERTWAQLLQLRGGDAAPLRACHQQVAAPAPTCPHSPHLTAPQAPTAPAC